MTLGINDLDNLDIAQFRDFVMLIEEGKQGDEIKEELDIEQEKYDEYLELYGQGRSAYESMQEDGEDKNYFDNEEDKQFEDIDNMINELNNGEYDMVGMLVKYFADISSNWVDESITELYVRKYINYVKPVLIFIGFDSALNELDVVNLSPQKRILFGFVIMVGASFIVPKLIGSGIIE